MADDKQTSVEQTEAETSQSSAEEAGATDDLDSLLSEWEQSQDSQQQTDSKGGQTDESDDEVKQYVRELREKEIREQTEKDVGQAVETMQEVISENLSVDNDVLTDFIYGRAARDQRVLNAFNQRHQNPKAWNSLVKALAKDYVSKHSVDKATTEDREAVASAVRSASKAPATDDSFPSEDELNKMTDKEFNKLMRKQMGR